MLKLRDVIMTLTLDRELIEELSPTIKESIDRKQENVRRRKKKDALRLTVSKLFHLLAKNGTLAHRSVIVSPCRL